MHAHVGTRLATCLVGLLSVFAVGEAKAATLYTYGFSAHCEPDYDCTTSGVFDQASQVEGLVTFSIKRQAVSGPYFTHYDLHRVHVRLQFDSGPPVNFGGLLGTLSLQDNKPYSFGEEEECTSQSEACWREDRFDLGLHSKDHSTQVQFIMSQYHWAPWFVDTTKQFEQGGFSFPVGDGTDAFWIFSESGRLGFVLDRFELEAVTVPEPSLLLLGAASGVGLVVRRRR